ncbi:MAG: hypothetical protein A2Z83_09555 [Omnitrophica bacterium GWA2_52_8]|nr:MAG: hypothetical protein A2Z83_09555 [Omnitrophica bacterium GWA2_52_8]
MKKSHVFGLVCAGGGAHGAYQVGVLKYIHHYFSDGKQSPFQIFSGTSCGSLNTSFYASHSHDAHAARLRLEELWLEFHIPKYHGNLIRNFIGSTVRDWLRPPEKRKPLWTLLDPKPMRDIVHKGFQRENLEKALRAGTTRGIAVSATELLSGRTCWFQEGLTAAPWNLFHSLGIIDQISPEHIEASCSVPVFLPPVKIGERYYVDGSVSLHYPFSAAMTMGAGRILAIATDKPIPAQLPHYVRSFRPKFSHIVRMMLNQLGHDHAPDEAAQIEVLNHFYEQLAKKHKQSKDDRPSRPLFHEEAHLAHYHPTDIFLFYPSRRIRQSDFEELEDNSGAAKPRRTRFLFHKKFIRELIDLGYDDAQAKHQELKTFFTSAPKPESRFHFFRRNRPQE